MIWLLLVALALLVTVAFWAIFWDLSRWVGDVTRRVAYAERCLVRMERGTEDFYWSMLREGESEHARDLHLARTAPVMTLNVRATFMARNTLKVMQ